MLCPSAIVVLLPSIDLVVNRRVWALRWPTSRRFSTAGPLLHHFYRFDLGGAAFLWRGDQMWNLNDLIDPASGWELLAAEGINNRGMIVGYGRLRAEIRSFLLVPRGRSW
jgi:hypothetical protein